MINPTALRVILITLTRACKTSAQENAALAVEIASLRETVRALDPTFSETFQTRKQEHVDLIAPKFSTLIQMFDEIIGRLEAGEVC